MIRKTVFETVEFKLSKDTFFKLIRSDLFEDDLLELADNLFSYAVENLHPCFGGVVADVDSFNPDSDPIEVEIAGTIFKGNIIKRLHGIPVVAPYYVTCGTEFENYDISNIDPMADFFIDTLKSMVLEQARKKAVKHFAMLINSKTVSSINPGSGNIDFWDICQLRKIFEIIEKNNCLRNIHLTDSCLMLPNKSVSGIYYPTEKEIFTCSACTRVNCPTRRG